MVDKEELKVLIKKHQLIMPSCKRSVYFFGLSLPEKSSNLREREVATYLLSCIDFDRNSEF